MPFDVASQSVSYCYIGGNFPGSHSAIDIKDPSVSLRKMHFVLRLIFLTSLSTLSCQMWILTSAETMLEQFVHLCVCANLENTNLVVKLET